MYGDLYWCQTFYYSIFLLLLYFYREIQEERGTRERKGHEEDLGLEDLGDLLDL